MHDFHAGRGARRRHDRPRLGADHEARLARSSPTAAAAPATRRSSPASSASPPSSAPATPPATLADGREVTVSCAEGDTGFVYDGLLDFTVEETELDAMPEIAGQDHDERRHAGPGVRVLPAAQRTASGWPGWSSSSTGRSASTPRRCSSSTTLERAAARREIAERDRRVRRPAGVTSSSASPRASATHRRGVRARAGDRADVATSSPTSTPTSSAASCTSRTRRTR